MEANMSDVEQILQDAIAFKLGPFQADVLNIHIVKEFLSTQLTEWSRKDADVISLMWPGISDALPEKLSRVRTAIGSRDLIRVRCIRNIDYWASQPEESVANEATRAMEYLHDPDNVRDRMLTAAT